MQHAKTFPRNGEDERQPGTLESVARNPSFFADRSLTGLLKLRAIQCALVDHQWPDDSNSTVRMGQLLISAIVNGALLDSSLWDRWLAALRNGVRYKDGLWLELSYSAEDRPLASEDNRVRRWFPDHITQMLLLRWLHETNSDSASSVSAASVCIRAFFTAARIEFAVGEDEVETLLNLAELKWGIHMPPILVDYARGRGPSVSITAPRWTRILRGQPVFIPRPQARLTGQQNSAKAAVTRRVKSAATETMPVGDEDYYCEHWNEAPETVVQLLRKRLDRFRNTGRSSGKTRTLRNQVLQLLDTASPTLNEQHLIRFVHARLTAWEAGNNKWKGLRPSTLLSYITHLESTVLSYFGADEDITDQPAEDLAEVYESILEETQPSQYKRRVSAIEAFQEYLETVNPAIALLFDEYKRDVRPSRVDANLVSSADFRRTIDRFPTKSRKDRICRLLLILGFRTGLRYSEATGILRGDVKFAGNYVELQIRPNQYRPLKTRSSRRSLPLDVLLTPAELQELNEWCNDFDEDPLGKGDLLFTSGSQRDRRISQYFADQIRQALRDATADEHVRYHTLRHSFASYLLATFLLPSDNCTPPPLKGLDDDLISWDRRQRVSDRILGSSKLGRSAVHGVSALCGHASIETTLLIYNHLFDVMVAMHVCRPTAQPQLSPQSLALLSGHGTKEAALRAFYRHYRSLVQSTDDKVERSAIAAGSPALAFLRKSGNIADGPFRPGTNYLHVLLKKAQSHWGTPLPNIELACGPIAANQRKVRSRRKASSVRKKAAVKPAHLIRSRKHVEQLRHDEKAAREIVKSLRWPDAVVCPFCDHEGAHEMPYKKTARGKPTDRQQWRCRACRRKFSVTAGTQLHRSRLSLGNWIYTAHLVCSSKSGLSRQALADILLIDHRSATFIYRRIWQTARMTPLGRALGIPVATDSVHGMDANDDADDQLPARIGGANKRPIYAEELLTYMLRAAPPS